MKGQRRSLISRAIGVRELPVMLLLAALAVYFVMRAPNFGDPISLFEDIKQYAPQALLAVGMTLIIGSAGIDISVGSTLGLSTVVLGVVLSRTSWGLPIACILAMSTGAAIGAFNGFAIARIKLQPVVATLSTYAAARGLCYVVAGQNISSIALPARAEALPNSYLSPAPIVIAVLLVAAGALILHHTILGRFILAIGSSEEAARFSGINVARVKLSIYTLTGALAGLAGIITAAWMNTASVEAGLGTEFEAITAVLIGGTSISGGEATVIGSALGILTIAVINRGFVLMQVNQFQQMMCLGVILIVSVLLDGLRKYIARRSAVGERAK